ncbi:MAG: radical SAM protein, partial [Treponema sp.]|nr:radical SAM protein [Treponema sp.]
AVLNPAYRLYSDEDLRRKLVYVEASRDCPFACAFCQSAIKTARAEDSPHAEASRRKSVREFPLDGFLSGMEDLLERLFSVRRISEKSVPPSALKRPTIKFLDRSFNADIPRALSIMEFFLEKMSRVSAGFQLHFEMVPSLFSPDLIKMISRFPPETLRLELGVQSLNPEVCAAIGRPSFPEKELETLALLRARTNAIIHADLIAGLPGEDCASFGDGFDRLWQALTVSSVSGGMSGAGPGTADTIAPPRLPSAAPPFEIQLGILKGLPGTPLGKLDKKFGMRYSPEPPYEVIETAALGKADLDRLRNFARFWELIVNRPWKAGGNPAAALLVPGKPVFRPFMDLAEKLFRFFGRNWGIDRKALGGAVLDFSGRDAITGA